MKKKLRECLTNPNIFNKDVKMKTNMKFTSPNIKFNIMKEYHDNLVKMNAFEKKTKQTFSKIQESSSETKMFIKNYNKLNKTSRRDMIVHSFKLSPFKDILFEYQKRKVKPPLITENKNLFKISPLISSHSQIEKYFRYYKKNNNKENEHQTKGNSVSFTKDKNLNYLERVNNHFNDYIFHNKLNELKRFTQTSCKSLKTKLTKAHSKNIFVFKSSHNILTDKDNHKTQNKIAKENQMLFQYNHNLEKIISNNKTNRLMKREQRNRMKTQELSSTTTNLETRSTRYNTHDFKQDMLSTTFKHNNDLLDKLSNFIHYKKGNSHLHSFTEKELETTYRKVKKLNLDSFSLDLPQKTLYLVPFDSNSITKDLKELKLKVQNFDSKNIPKIKQSYISLNRRPKLDKVDSIKKLDTEIASFEQVYTEKISVI